MIVCLTQGGRALKAFLVQGTESMAWGLPGAGPNLPIAAIPEAQSRDSLGLTAIPGPTRICLETGDAWLSDLTVRPCWP